MRKMFFGGSVFIALALLCLVVNPGCGDDDKATNGGGGSATVTGTLTLEHSASGKVYVVLVDNDTQGENGYIEAVEGTCGSGTSVNYSISNVPTGTYYIYAAVWVESDGSQGPQEGDLYGIYGGSLSNFPDKANAQVPSSGTVDFDITLYVWE